MGHHVDATCQDCGLPFTVEHGGGFVFHLLRCDNCGRTKPIGFDQLGELHLRYLKGLPGPYCVGTSEHDKYVREQVDIQPISEEEYHRNVEYCIHRCEEQGTLCRHLLRNKGGACRMVPCTPSGAKRHGRPLLDDLPWLCERSGDVCKVWGTIAMDCGIMRPQSSRTSSSGSN
jgi:hypothetical protein